MSIMPWMTDLSPTRDWMSLELVRRPVLGMGAFVPVWSWILRRENQGSWVSIFRFFRILTSGIGRPPWTIQSVIWFQTAMLEISRPWLNFTMLNANIWSTPEMHRTSLVLGIFFCKDDLLWCWCLSHFWACIRMLPEILIPVYARCWNHWWQSAGKPLVKTH